MTKSTKTATDKPKTARSLTTTLAISFFSLSALVLLLSSSVQIVFNIQAQQVQIENRQRLIAENAAKSISTFFQEKFTAMETAVEFSDSITSSPQSRSAFLNGMLGIEPAFRQIVLLDDQGRRLDSISRVSQDVSAELIAQLTEDLNIQTSSGQRYIGSVYINDTTSEPLITLAIPATDASGDFQGTLVAEVNLKSIWDLVNQIEVGETGYVYVVDNQGTLIAYRDTSLVLQGINVRGYGNISNFIDNPSNPAPAGIHRYTGLSSVTVVGTYIPLGIPQWAVVIESPWREAYQDVMILGLRSIILFFIIAILASLAGYYGARRASAPLIDLSNVAKEVAKGNLSAEAQETGAVEFAQLANSFNHMTSQLRDSIGNLEQRVTERTNDLTTARIESDRREQKLQSINEISRIISSEQTLHILLPLITRLVSDKFNFYHAGIFLIDENRLFAVLQAANSEGGQRMLNRGHRLELGTGIVGTVTLTGKPRIALDVGADAVFFDNPDLPATRSEMALPLTVRGETIGALDVQSIRAGEFSEDDTNLLGILADQVAIAIENARLFTKMQQALDEVQALYNQYIQKEWKVLHNKTQNVGYLKTLNGGKPLVAPIESDDIQHAVRTGQTLISRADGGEADPVVVVPIKLRGRTIGVLNIKATGRDREWSRDELNLIQSVTDRLALAMENARLFEETARRAEREKLVSEITGKIRSVNDPQVMIQTAVDELRNILGASRVQVVPQIPPGSDTNVD